MLLLHGEAHMGWRTFGSGAALAAGSALVVALPVLSPTSGSAPAAAGSVRAHRAAAWVNAWQGSPVPGGTIPGPGFNCPSDQGLRDQTVRNVVFVTAGGDRVRVRLTNAFGARPLQVGAASVAIAASGAATISGSSRALRFGGRPSILVAAGGEALSDPVSLGVK